jgi:hypothetical protein
VAVGTLKFGEEELEYTWWAGEQLRGTPEKPLALDTETELIRPVRELLEGESVADVPSDPRHVPRPALGMAYDGDHLVLLHPSQFAKFVSAHRSQSICGQNVAFDFHVLLRHFDGDRGSQALLWQWGEQNRLCDTMILDMLLQLGTGVYRRGVKPNSEEAKIYPTSLGVLAKDWGVGDVDKASPYRLRFGELLGLTRAEMDGHPEAAGFYDYALGDVVATFRIYQKQRAAAVALMRKAGWSPNPKQKTYEIRPDALAKFGPLSEYIQVKGSIALAELSRTPLRIDLDRRREAEAASRTRYAAALEKMLAREPGLVKRFKVKAKAGVLKTTKATVLPQFDQKKLTEVLVAEAAALNATPPVSDGKLRRVSVSTKAWARFADRSPFVASWVELEKEGMRLQFLRAVDAPEVYSRYDLLKLNGRTSAGKHERNRKMLLPSVNVQQMPRDDAVLSVRGLFQPPEGKLWYSCDYSYVELRTLAAVCKARYGWSKLAEAIDEHTLRGGVDPHQRTAAMLLDLSPEEFLRLDKAKQKKFRQSSKAVNFGYPGGLGIRTFIVYAKTQYDADFTPTEAKAAKAKWMELYPEMKLHLEDRTQAALDWQTGKRTEKLGWLAKKRLSDFLRADDAGRAKFSEEEADAVWDRLLRLAKAKGDAAAVEEARDRTVNSALRRLVTYRACTLTGRVRNNVKFTDGANTPFSGLAADGGKLALFELLRRGFRVLGFVHDSTEVAIDPRQATSQCKTVNSVMVAAMETVCGHGIPVAVEGAVADRWSKA